MTKIGEYHTCTGGSVGVRRLTGTKQGVNDKFVNVYAGCLVLTP